MGGDDRFMDVVKRRFDSPEEVDEYRRRAGSGLLAWETTVVARYLASPGRLLDVGCGGGREAFALSDLGFDVVGVDISAPQLDSARATATALGKAVEFHLWEGNALPFADGTFDCAVAWAQVLGNVLGAANRLRFLAECRRVVKDKGRLSFSAHNRETCEPTARSHGMIQAEAGLPLEDGDYVLVGDSESPAPCVWHYFTRDELVDTCGQAGLKVLECCLAEELGQDGWDTVWVCVCENESRTGKRTVWEDV